ncbi:MAG: PilZ domain-containing protein [Thermodesulfobacteriota bacterium]
MKFKQDINERRSGVRIDFKVPVEICCAETDTMLKGVLVNLSIHGMLLELHEDYVPVAIDTKKECKARLFFRGKGSKLVIDELLFTVVRAENNRLALKFSEPLEWFLLFTVYKDKQLRNEAIS